VAQAPRQLRPYESPGHFFGAELRHWRELRNLSQDALGRLVHVSGDAVSKIEKALRWPQPGLAEACDAVLNTGGVLARLWPLVDAQRRNSQGHADNRRPHVDNPADPAVLTASSGTMVTLRVDEEGNVWAEIDRRRFLVAAAGTVLANSLGAGIGAPDGALAAAAAPDDPFGFANMVTAAWPGLRLSRPTPAYDVDYHLLLPGGRAMTGSDLAVQLHAARTDGDRILASVPASARRDEFLGRTGRGLLVGACPAEEGRRFYLLDARGGRSALDIRARGDELVVPTAYELDDLTYAILWAVGNLDDALQADDQALAEARSNLKAYEQLSASAVSREAAPGLNPVAHMWLGSDFCAHHILRGLPELPALPAFWTREQRGEEASAWLLFDHKYHYLRQTTQTLGASTIRAFCIPENAVRESPRYERILLFLAIALMESLGIQAKVTTDPAYGNVEGFVIAPRKQAIIANWVRGDGIWHVDTTTRTPIIREFTDVAGQVGAHSVIEAPTPADRLRALASYLGLEWSWLRSRCAALAEYGTDGLIQTRSRLVSARGLDSACAFVGSLPSDS
jgi:DNA-binding XRE family transcriptional regulator